MPSSTTTINLSQQQQQQQPPSSSSSLPIIPETTVQPASAEPIDSSPTNPTDPTTISHQLLQLPFSSTTKQRDKLETISERIESLESQASQITSVNQSPPLQRPPRSSKWKWLKTGSTEPENKDSKPAVPTVKSPTGPQPHTQLTNPFDPNLSDDDTNTKLIENTDQQRPAIPMSLFIPRSAQLETLKTSEHGSDEQVINKKHEHTHIILFSFSMNN